LGSENIEPMQLVAESCAVCCSWS